MKARLNTLPPRLVWIAAASAVLLAAILVLSLHAGGRRTAASGRTCVLLTPQLPQYPACLDPAHATLVADQATMEAPIPGVTPRTPSPVTPYVWPNPLLTVTPEIVSAADENGGPFHQGYLYNNEWHGVVSGQFVIVVGGDVETDASQGILSVRTVPIGGNGSIEQVDTPTRGGMVTLTGWNGPVISYTLSNGDSGTYNVQTRAFGP